MIDLTAKLSVSRQAIVLGISRSSIYYQPCPVSDADLKLMRRMDKRTSNSRSRVAGCCRGCWSRKGSRLDGCTLPC